METAAEIGTNTAGSPGADGKRKRQPRNSACQACSSLKMKCVPAAEAPNICERCHRMGRECVSAIPKPRKRRAATGDASETPTDTPQSLKLTDLIDQDATRGAKLKQDTRKSTHSKAQDVQVDAAESRSSLLSKADLAHTGSRNFALLFSEGLDNAIIPFVARDPLIGVDYTTVQNRLAIFRQISIQFPFVEVSPAADVVSMVVRRPVQTLAICIVASAANPDLQHRLVNIWKTSLANKAIIQGERSFDLLLGLLVFLAWHHHYMQKNQIYQYLHLLAGMVSDLGLRKHATGLHPSEAMEYDRALLGCYYLACGLSTMGFGKPTPLRWDATMHHSGERLRAGSNLPSDQTLLSAIALQHAVENIHEVMDTELSYAKSTNSTFMEMHAKVIKQRMQTLKHEHPSLGGTLGYPAAVIHLQHKVLSSSDSPDSSSLITCACTIKDYIDDLLARPAATLHQLAILDWTSLMTTLVLMARLSKPLPHAAGWEAGALHSMLQPEQTLDALCAHMGGAPEGDPLSPRNESLLLWFCKVCDSIKIRILHGRDPKAASSLLNGESQYETLSALGRGVDSAEPSSVAYGGRFRPVNQEAPTEHNMNEAQLEDPTFDFLGSGFLDSNVWETFMVE